MILIGGGTGLAPLKSIVRHVLEQGLDQRLYLYQGARAQADLYDVEFFRALAEQHPEQFTYRPCLSDEEWDGPTGMVTDVVAADFETCRQHTAYLCGPPPMVEAALKTLMKKRLFPEGHLPGGLLRRVRQGDRRRSQPAAGNVRAIDRREESQRDVVFTPFMLRVRAGARRS